MLSHPSGCGLRGFVQFACTLGGEAFELLIIFVLPWIAPRVPGHTVMPGLVLGPGAAQVRGLCFDPRC